MGFMGRYKAEWGGMGIFGGFFRQSLIVFALRGRLRCGDGGGLRVLFLSLIRENVSAPSWSCPC